MLLLKNRKLIIVTLSLLFPAIFHSSSWGTTLTIKNNSNTYNIRPINIKQQDTAGYTYSSSAGENDIIQKGGAPWILTLRADYWLSYTGEGGGGSWDSTLDLEVWPKDLPIGGSINSTKQTCPVKLFQNTQTVQCEKIPNIAITVEPKNPQRYSGYNYYFKYYDYVITVNDK